MDDENAMSVEMPIFLFYVLLGSTMLVVSNDFFFAFMVVELQSFSLYLLVAGHKYSNLSMEAALKYFILGSYSSALILLGISLIYFSLGETSILKIAAILAYTHAPVTKFINNLGLLLVILGFFFKFGSFPFHS